MGRSLGVRLDRRSRVKWFALVGVVLAVAFWCGFPAIAATHSVTISDDPQTGGKYSPSSIPINNNDSVQWSYPVGASQHTVSSRPGQAIAFDSGLISPGGQFSKQFKLNKPAGTYTITYYC